jgi:hypothetical protein
MRDDLMTGFLNEQTDLSFASWRAWAVDHGERHGSYAEFVGRLSRCQQALKRRKSLGQGQSS